MPANRRRIYDSEAFATLVREVEKRGTIMLSFSDAKVAVRIRAEFYSWRKQEQALNVTFASDIQVRCAENIVIFSATLDPTLRDALASAGVTISAPSPTRAEDSQLPLLEEAPPTSHMERTISARYGAREDPSENNS